jgi:hypothetical protein
MLGVSVVEAAYELGSGERVTAQDTVPFTVWVAARLLAGHPAAIRACVEAGGRKIRALIRHLSVGPGRRGMAGRGTRDSELCRARWIGLAG